MDKSKSPGIRFNQVVLKKSRFERKDMIEEGTPNINVNFNINNRLNKEKAKLFTEFTITLGENDDSPFYLDVSMIGVFSVDNSKKNMDLKEFSENNAPALVLPYLREYISNTTMRAGLKAPFILPPINVIKMMKEKNKE